MSYHKVEGRHFADGKPRWRVRYRVGGQEKSETYRSGTAARKRDQEIKARSRLGVFAPSDPSTELVLDYLARWFDDGQSRWDLSTVKQRQSVLRCWVEPYLDGVRLCDFGPAQFGAYFAQLPRDGCPKIQANKAFEILRAAFNDAVRDKLLPQSPTAGHRTYTATPQRPRALEPDKVEAIRFQLAAPRDRVLVAVLAYAGLRPGESLALRWRDVRGGSLIVDRSVSHGREKGTKTNSRRPVKLIAPLASDLELYRESLPAERVAPDALVFPPSRGQFIDWRTWVRRYWRPAAKAARVKGVPYDLRHTFCSLLHHEGQPLIYVASQLGQSVLRTQEMYAHIFAEDVVPGGLTMVDAVLLARTRVSQKCHSGESTDDAERSEDVANPVQDSNTVDGAYRDRTGDPQLAKLVLSQLS